MKWSWKIGRVAGIDLYVHATFLVLIAWVAFGHGMAGHGWQMTAAGVAFILTLFGCVLHHELAHALTAKAFGILTRDITLLPIGGLARLERMPEQPMQELWVALAGPTVNVVIAGVLYGILAMTGSLPTAENLEAWSASDGSFLGRLMVVNLGLAVFNMIPAFPMDGGRVLRALLATQMDFVRATQIAASVGQGLAMLFGFLGLFSNPLLVFIALFVWIGAAQEAAMAQMKSALGGIPVGRAMVRDFQTLAPDEPLTRAVELILAGSQTDFPVVEGDRVAGVLTRGDLLVALASRSQDTPVADVMQRDVQEVDAGEMMETAFARLESRGCQTLPVTSRGRLVGLLTTDNLGEFLMIQGALARQGPCCKPGGTA
jgi:Zn-dependent protease